jgi:hypothetical protein
MLYNRSEGCQVKITYATPPKVIAKQFSASFMVALYLGNIDIGQLSVNLI